MIAQEVAKKYAHALLMAVKEKSLVDQATEQFEGLLAMVRKDRTLIDFLTAPQVTDERKYELMRRVFGERLEQLFVEFLIVLIDKHRINYLEEILDEFERQLRAERGILRATVITAAEIPQTEYDRLVPILANKTGLKIEIEKRIQPEIMGGMIIILHNEIIDGSVKHGLDMVRDQLAKVKVA